MLMFHQQKHFSYMKTSAIPTPPDTTKAPVADEVDAVVAIRLTSRNSSNKQHLP